MPSILCNGEKKVSHTKLSNDLENTYQSKTLSLQKFYLSQKKMKSFKELTTKYGGKSFTNYWN